MISSRQDLADFCLRQLGAPILNIEIDEEQLTDCIDMAVQFYHEYHFEGIQKDFVSLQVTQEDIDRQYFLVPDSIFSVSRVIHTSSLFNSGDMLFNFQYQVMAGEVHHITNSGTSYLYTTMNYLSHLDFVLRKEKNFRFNRRMNEVHVDVNWAQEIALGSWVVLDVYRAVDPEVYGKVYNDLWLKKYATALIKKQWATNIKKYGNMTLPGGLTLNGQEAFSEAIIDINSLEAEAKDAGAPLSFMIG